MCLLARTRPPPFPPLSRARIERRIARTSNSSEVASYVVFSVQYLPSAHTVGSNGFCGVLQYWYCSKSIRQSESGEQYCGQVDMSQSAISKSQRIPSAHDGPEIGIGVACVFTHVLLAFGTKGRKVAVHCCWIRSRSDADTPSAEYAWATRQGPQHGSALSMFSYEFAAQVASHCQVDADDDESAIEEEADAPAPEQPSSSSTARRAIVGAGEGRRDEEPKGQAKW